MPRDTGKKSKGYQKRSSHGSMNKAGATRQRNPIVNWRTDKDGQKVKSKQRQKKKGKPSGGNAPKRGVKNKSPIINRRRQYNTATSCPTCGATIQIRTYKCWRCDTRLAWRGLRPQVKRTR